MANEVVQAKTLQERVGERIRDQIGDLLTDDDLKKLVDTALQEAFFKDRRVGEDRYGRFDTKPPLLVEHVHQLLQAQVKVAAQQWINDHADEVRKIIDARLSGGFSAMLAGVVDSAFQSAMWSFQAALKSGLIRQPGS